MRGAAEAARQNLPSWVGFGWGGGLHRVTLWFAGDGACLSIAAFVSMMTRVVWIRTKEG